MMRCGARGSGADEGMRENVRAVRKYYITLLDMDTWLVIKGQETEKKGGGVGWEVISKTVCENCI